MTWLSDRLATQPSALGVWLATGSPVAAELAALAGFDWALIDLEHGQNTEADLLRLIGVLTPTGCAAIVRLGAADSELAKKALDAGAAGLMAPMISDPAAAAAFARSLRYPPQGTRGLASSCRAAGYGATFAEYFAAANAKVTGLVQIETAAALVQVDAIAAVEGVDVLFIGHSDLSLALGCHGDLAGPVMQDAEARVLAACTRHGKRAGMLLKAGADPAPYRAKGFTLLALGSDLGCLRQGYERLLGGAR